MTRRRWAIFVALIICLNISLAAGVRAAWPGIVDVLKLECENGCLGNNQG